MDQGNREQPGRAVPIPSDLRMIGTDLDGTLLLPDGSVGDRTRAALGALRMTSIDLVIVTGRPTRWIAPVVTMTGHEGIGVAANGAVVLDLADGRVTEVMAFSPEGGLEVIERLRLAFPGVVFAVERARVGDQVGTTGGSAYTDPEPLNHERSDFALGLGYRPRWRVPEGVPVGPIEDVVALGDTVKILARPGAAHALDADLLWATGAAALDGIAEATHSNPDDVLLEVSVIGVDKGSALARVAAAHGLTRDQVATVGDAPNDLPMLRWAGFACAVANAHPLVLAEADYILPSNDEEGVADLIEAAEAQALRR